MNTWRRRKAAPKHPGPGNRILILNFALEIRKFAFGSDLNFELKSIDFKFISSFELKQFDPKNVLAGKNDRDLAEVTLRVRIW